MKRVFQEPFEKKGFLNPLECLHSSCARLVLEGPAVRGDNLIPGGCLVFSPNPLMTTEQETIAADITRQAICENWFSKFTAQEAEEQIKSLLKKRKLAAEPELIETILYYIAEHYEKSTLT